MDIRYFLGANSAGGFYSHYDQLLPEPIRRSLRILKGGPGCGKSTLMKKVAAHALQLGMTVHYIPCTSDPDSLDGIVIPEAGYAIVDGTAPHVVEPKLCGCSEAYLDLGSGYNEEGLFACRHILNRIRQANLECYPRATSCLKMAAALEPHALPGSHSLSAELADDICRKELPERGPAGSCRTVFLSGYTPKGRITHWNTVDTLCSKVYALRGIPSEISAFLTLLKDTALKRGWDCIHCDSPLLPGKQAEHLLIPELGLAFVSDTPSAPYPGKAFRILGDHPDLDHVQTTRQALLREAASHLHQAKEYHDLLEAAYAPFVDFSAANRAALDCCAELELLAAHSD